MQTDGEAIRRIKSQLGGEEAWAKLPVVLNALRCRSLLEKAQSFGRAANGMADEAALIKTLQANRIWAAALDVTADEPLPADSPLWSMPNVFITPHTAGETRAYEDNVLDILMENLDRLWRGEKALRNQVL